MNYDKRCKLHYAKVTFAILKRVSHDGHDVINQLLYSVDYV